MNAQTVPPAPVHHEHLTPEDIARILDGAADLMERDGRWEGDWWPTGYQVYKPGDPCCAAGAIAVTIGHTVPDQVVDLTASTDGGADDDAVPHPAFAALMRWLKVATPEAVFAWSDDHTESEVVQGLRDCAAHVRAGGAA